MITQVWLIMGHKNMKMTMNYTLNCEPAEVRSPVDKFKMYLMPIRITLRVKERGRALEMY